MGMVNALDMNNETDTVLSEKMVSGNDNVNQIDELTMEKQITKDHINNKNIKTDSKEYDVTSYKTFNSALTSNKYSDVTINIKSSFNLMGNTSLNNAVTNLKINGNSETVYGANEYQFLRVFDGSSVIINNITIKNCLNNAIDNRGNITIENSSFISNNATTSGGAINNNGLAIIKCNKFDNNTAQYGGAINNKGNITVINNTFNKNVANNGAAINNNGLATIINNNFINHESKIYGTINNYVEATINNNTFDNNKANNGAAISNNDDNGVLTVSKNTFINNIARNGGAIYNNGKMTVIENIFDSNTAEYGGAVNINKGKITISNNTFKNNNATLNGGAINNGGEGIINKNNNFINNQAAYGGAINNYYLSNITGNMFIGNRADNGGSINVHDDTTAYITYNNFTKNYSPAGSAIHVDGNATIKYNLFEYNNATYGTININKGEPLIEYNNFTHNNASYGSAINNNKAIVKINYNNFNNNIATKMGGAINNYGNIILKNNNFSSNHATEHGGAINNNAKASMSNNIFNKNTAKYGGAITNNLDGDAIINNNNFTSNNASQQGGAIHNNAKASINKNNFINNSANLGGAINNLKNASITSNNFTNNNATYGLSINNNRAFATITDNTFICNPDTNNKQINQNGNGTVKNNKYIAEQAILDALVVTVNAPKTITTGQDAKINITVTTKNKFMVNTTAIMKINGLTQKDNNGNVLILQIKNGKTTYTLPLKGYSTKDYIIQISTVDKKYERSEGITKMTVLKGKCILNPITINSTSEGQITINQTIKDAYGKIISGITQVAIKLGDRTVITTKITDGKLNVKVKVPYLPEGKNKFKITLGENYRYESVIINNTLNIHKQNITANITPIKSKAGQNISITTKLINQETKTNVISGKFAYKLDGKAITGTTTGQVKNAIAQLTYTLPKDITPGTHTITIVYAGNKQSNILRYSAKVLTIIT